MAHNQYFLSPTSEVSRQPANSLGGIGNESHDDYNPPADDWTLSSNDTVDYAHSMISSRDPGIPDDTLIRSYNKYIWYNGFRFMIITSIIMVVAFCRHYVLYNHYDDNLCCFCYQQAAKHTSIIFEWQTCHYDLNINSPNQKCKFETTINAQNISTNYNLFLVSWYYLVTASIVFGIALVYATLTFSLTCRVISVDKLLSQMPLELMIAYNVFISILCFYQLTIDYQFYPSPDFEDASGKQCYVNSLSKHQENSMNYVLITAFVYIISTICLIFGLYVFKHYVHFAIYRLFERIYNWLFFGCCSIIIILFFGFVLFVTFGLILTHFMEKSNWTAWVVIIVLDISICMSLIDICYFVVFRYPRNPFSIIMQSNSCFKMCCRHKYGHGQHGQRTCTQIQNHKIKIMASCESNDTFVH